MADLDYNSLSNHLFRPENIDAMMLPIVEPENGAADTAVSSPIPDELPILPLRGVVVYPLTAVPLTVGQPRSIQLIDDLLHLSKIARQDMDRVEIDLSSKALKVMEDLRELYQSRNVEVVVQEGLVRVKRST